MEIKAPPLDKAQENCLTIAGLVKKLHYDFLELGGLLLENRNMGYWNASGCESFKDFIQQLGISYDWATRMMGLAEIVAQQLLTPAEVVEMGVAKATLLLPHVKNGTLPEDIKLLARDCSWNDLRKELGHNLVDPDNYEEFVNCPHCGYDIILQPGMIKRR